MPAIALIQHSVVMLDNGNAVIHVSEKSENLFPKAEEVLRSFKTPFKVRWMDLSESDGIATLSLVLEPSDAPGEWVFIYRADRALFFQRIPDIMKKMHISENDVSKCSMAESMGYVTAAYSYERSARVSER